MSPVDYGQLIRLALPAIIVVVTALLVMAVDLLVFRRRPIRARMTIASVLAIFGCIVAIVFTMHAPFQSDFANGMLIATPLVRDVQVLLLALTIFILLLSAESEFTPHVGEFVLLVLIATTGMLFLVATQDILVVFISLEILSLSLYILSAFNKRSLQSWEAALKYFLFGGMSAAFLLFGFSLLYGLSNSTNLVQIAGSIHGSTLDPILIIAIVTVAIGLGFKVAAAPFHFWAPDVYQGAPVPSAAFIASSSKVASFFILFQITAVGLAAAAGTAFLPHPIRGWVPVIAILAVFSMLLGNFVAVVQTSLRRLLAYSAIAHAGYMLLAVVAHTPQSLVSLLYYVVTYALATIGAFGVISVVENSRNSDQLTSFEGLGQEAPALSLCLAIFILSLAGIPPLAGFFGKFYLFATVLQSTPGSISLLWLVVVAIAMSAVSLYYYLKVLKKVFVEAPHADTSRLRVPVITQIAVVLLALAVLILGCAPHLLINPLQHAIQASSF